MAKWCLIRIKTKDRDRILKPVKERYFRDYPELKGMEFPISFWIEKLIDYWLKD